jgi:hypothetical protein
MKRGRSTLHKLRSNSVRNIIAWLRKTLTFDGFISGSYEDSKTETTLCLIKNLRS